MHAVVEIIKEREGGRCGGEFVQKPCGGGVIIGPLI
jgi:hypothetical protein